MLILKFAIFYKKLRKTLVHTPRKTWKVIAKVLPVFFEPVIIFFKKTEKFRKKETLKELIINWNFVPSGIIISKKR